MVENIREVEVHLSDSGKGVGGVPDYGGVHLEKSEHGHAVHSCVIASGHV